MILLAHVWQSTVCVGVAALLAWFLRHAPARARHQLWLLASAKFLVPFVTVVAAGRFAAPWVPSFVTPHLSGDIHWLDQSSALWDFRAGGGVLSHALLSDLAPVLTWALMVLWASGTAAILWSRWRTWRTFTLRSRASVKLEAGREADAFHRVHARQPSGRAIKLVGWDAP